MNALAGSSDVTVPQSEPGIEGRWFVLCEGPGGVAQATVTVPIQTLLGAVIPPENLFVDSDVNDTSATPWPNDSLETSQPIPFYGLVAGYVNRPRRGPTGRSYQDGDAGDFFDPGTMSAGQVVRLVLPTVDFDQPVTTRDDADLYLWDADGNLVDAAVGSGNMETLVIPRQADYFIEVRAVSGGFNYLLALEDAAAPANASADRLSAEFVPGEAIVVLNPSATGASKVTASMPDQNPGFARKAGVSSRELKVVFTTSSLARRKATIAAAVAHAAGTKELNERTATKLATLLELKQLRSRSDVRHAELNRILTGHAEPPQDAYEWLQRWHYDLVNAPVAWLTTTGSPDVIVAVVDSGLVLDHPDLRSRLVPGYDFVSNAAGLDGTGIEADPGDPGFSSGGEWIFHGTHVAGTIAAEVGNLIGGRGIAARSRVMPLRALDGRTGTEYDVLQAVRFAAGLANDSGTVPTQRADIINLSLGRSGQCSAAEEAVLALARAAGVILVASAGNDGSSDPYSPASCAGVISVGALRSDGARADYSNFGDHVSLFAPGGEGTTGVYSTHAERRDGRLVSTYRPLTGTSMAAPHVSGVLALMKSVKPTLSPIDIDQLLGAGKLTDDVGEPGRDYFGFGQLNAALAVQAAGGIIPTGPRVMLLPGVLDLGTVDYTGQFEIRNAGNGTLTIDAMRSTVPWATAGNSFLPPYQPGLFHVRIERGMLTRGVHHGSIEVVTSAGTRTLSLIATVLNFGLASALSPVRVRVLNVADDTVLEQITLQSARGESGYRFDNVSPGRIMVLAGTDLNNDGNICDAGEVCGTYPTATVPDAFDFDGLRTQLLLRLQATALAVAQQRTLAGAQ